MALMMSYIFDFLLSQGIYSDMNQIKKNVYNDASTEIMNVPIAPHNDRFFLLFKTQFNFHDFKSFVHNNSELQTNALKGVKVLS